jgi:hypothetical protein
MSYKKIANGHWEEEASWTTRSFSKHGLGKTRRRVKIERNRVAKKIDAAWHFGSQA